MRLPLLLALSLPLMAAPPPKTPQAKNVILMLADGVDTEAWALARWLKKGENRLHVDAILSGAVRTYGSDTLVTDSAPGATAYATGRKAQDKSLSVEPQLVTMPGVPKSEHPWAPMATLLEGARLGGRATGLVATIQIQHASPAAFAAHTPNREDYEDIGLQQVHQGIDVVLGGGSTFLKKRKDTQDLVKFLEKQNYLYGEDAAAMEKMNRTPAWGAFAARDLACDLDRARLQPKQPTLAQMTHKAIELLANSPKGTDKGFFLFVEGSKTDLAAHTNEPVGLITELLAFDEAVGEALAFAKKRADTLVVVLSDHSTGGLSLGLRNTPYPYSQTPYGAVIEPLRRCKLTAEGMLGVFAALPEKEQTEQKFLTLFQAETGLKELGKAELAELRTGLTNYKAEKNLMLKSGHLLGAMGSVISWYAGIGWTTGGHTGSDVFLFSHGPGKPEGLWENIAIGNHLASAMGFELPAVTSRLFVEATSLFKEAGFQATLEKDKRLLKVTRDGWTATVPMSTNQVVYPNQETVAMEGIAVLTKDDQVYLPKEAVKKVQAGWDRRAVTGIKPPEPQVPAAKPAQAAPKPAETPAKESDAGGMAAAA